MICAGCLFTLTHIPVPAPLTEWVSMRDLALHFSAYGALAALTGAGYGRCWPAPLLLAGLTGFAALDEFTQGFVGRTPDVRDWGADALGAACGLGLALRVFPVPRSRAREMHIRRSDSES